MSIQAGGYQATGRRSFLYIMTFGWALAGCAAPVTPWPANQARLRPRLVALHSAPGLPEDIVIEVPGPDVPAELRPFSGIWTGTLGARGEFAIDIAVRQVEADRLVITYASYAALYNRPPFLTRIDMERVGGGAEFTGGAVGFRVALRLRADGNLDLLAGPASLRTWQSGVLVRRRPPTA